MVNRGAMVALQMLAILVVSKEVYTDSGFLETCGPNLLQSCVSYFAELYNSELSGKRFVVNNLCSKMHHSVECLLSWNTECGSDPKDKQVRHLIRKIGKAMTSFCDMDYPKVLKAGIILACQNNFECKIDVRRTLKLFFQRINTFDSNSQYLADTCCIKFKIIKCLDMVNLECGFNSAKKIQTSFIPQIENFLSMLGCANEDLTVDDCLKDQKLVEVRRYEYRPQSVGPSIATRLMNIIRNGTSIIQDSQFHNTRVRVFDRGHTFNNTKGSSPSYNATQYYADDFTEDEYTRRRVLVPDIGHLKKYSPHSTTNSTAKVFLSASTAKVVLSSLSLRSVSSPTSTELITNLTTASESTVKRKTVTKPTSSEFHESATPTKSTEEWITQTSDDHSENTTLNRPVHHTHMKLVRFDAFVRCLNADDYTITVCKQSLALLAKGVNVVQFRNSLEIELCCEFLAILKCLHRINVQCKEVQIRQIKSIILNHVDKVRWDIASDKCRAYEIEDCIFVPSASRISSASAFFCKSYIIYFAMLFSLNYRQ